MKTTRTSPSIVNAYATLNNTSKAFPHANQCLHEIIQQQAQSSPDAIALLFGNETLSYHTLNSTANQLSHYLVDLGIPIESLVGVCLDRSFALFTTLLGVMKAGAAYVPLDPDLPKQRLDFLIQDSQAPLIITQEKYQHLFSGTATKILIIDKDDISGNRTDNPSLPIAPLHLIYMIYTSGSTGNPKGALNTHRAVVNRLEWMQDAYQLTTEDIVMHKTPYSFDVSVWELFWPLMYGAHIAIAEPGGHLNPDYLIALTNRHRVSIMHFVPSMLRYFLGAIGTQKLPSLREVIVSGEALTTELQQRFFSLFSCNLHNLYGPTETAVDVTYWQCIRDTQSTSVPIGKPIANVNIYILDANLDQVPQGTMGELYIGGVAVGKGYHNRIELTKNTFIPDPFSDDASQLLYKSGDLASLNAAGYIEYHGRADFQIKIGGVRIEPDEVATVLQTHPSVKNSIVVGYTDTSGEKRLCAYFIPHATPPAVLELISFLAEKLPRIMIPTRFIQLQALPLNHNGKLDRSKLPNPDESSQETSLPLHAVSSTEAQLIAIWNSLLASPIRDTKTSFFEAGGNSLLLLKMGEILKQKFNRSIPVAELFQNPTIPLLLRIVDSKSTSVAQNTLSTPHIPTNVTAPVESIALSTEEKRKRLTEMLKQKAQQTSPRYNLSEQQKVFWFMHAIAPESAAYNVAFVAQIMGSIDTNEIERVFKIILQRHPILRSVYPSENGNPYMQYSGTTDIVVEIFDIAHLSEDEAIDQVHTHYKKPFQLDTGPLIRISLFKRAQAEQVFLLTIHHIACDGLSVGIILEEFKYHYTFADRAALPSPQIGYTDVIDQQVVKLASPEGTELLNYWKNKLGNKVSDLDIPADLPRAPIQRFIGGSYMSTIDMAEYTTIVSTAKNTGVTSYVVLLSALQALLYQYTDKEDIFIGTPMSGREGKGYETVVGCFINSVVLRVDLQNNPSMRELFAQNQRNLLEALDHQDYPFLKLVSELKIPRDLSKTPLFQVLFNLLTRKTIGSFADLLYRNKDDARKAPSIPFGALSLKPFPMPQEEGQFDLALEIVDTDISFSYILKYNAEIFEHPTIQRMAEHYAFLLHAIAADPGLHLQDLPLVSPRESSPLIAASHGTVHSHPIKLLHSIFEEQSKRVPAKQAIQCGNKHLSYADLNAQAEVLAQHLIAKGAQPDVPVGVFLNRSVEMVVALLGILKSGSPYLPLDPDFPMERLSYMIEHSHVSIIISEPSIKDSLPETVSTIIDIMEPIGNPEQRFQPPPMGPNNLAYVLYTSGSTGRPKGVKVHHGAVSNFIHSMMHTPGIAESDRLLAITTLSFDISVLEIFLPLSVGAQVFIASRPEALDGTALVAMLDKYEISLLQATPSTWRMLLAAGLNHSKLTALCGGEALPHRLAMDLLSKVGSLWNMYGPTETTIWSCLHEIKADQKTILVGKPVDNTTVFIVNKHLKLVPPGAKGELLIGGAGVSKGYWEADDLTAEKFIPNPFNPSDKGWLYQTGDIARFTINGLIQILGRSDHQVKIRGYRIELAEIETILRKHPLIAEVVVDCFQGPGDTLFLVAYFIAAQHHYSIVSDLRKFLLDQLPSYMVPAYYVEIQSMPLTPNGKVDRRALPQPNHERPEVGEVFIPAQSDTEKKLVDRWKEILQIDEIGINDSFFDLGGNSLSAMEIISFCQRTLNSNISIAQFFQFPTIKLLAQYIDTADRPAITMGIPGLRHNLSKAEPELHHADKPEYSTDIAVIGMAGRFPKAANLDEFWKNLCDGKECITFFNDSDLDSSIEQSVKSRPDYIKAKGILEGYDVFDPGFFRMSPREAEMIDPQQRIYLETVWEALEHAGYDPTRYRERIGNFAGMSNNTYFPHVLATRPDLIETFGEFQTMISNEKDFVATRVSHKLNLRGPSLSIYTACSTSLVAVCTAIDHLLLNNCEIAVAGGVSLLFPMNSGYIHHKNSIISDDGHCRAFDSKASGTLWGNGAGAVVLKRLSDAQHDNDTIHAVIRGHMVNNDGSDKMSFTAPSVNGQIAAIKGAHQKARVRPQEISYVEAHGTGTSLGDPIEISALNQAFGEDGSQKHCVVSSVKTNIGHLDTAAGIAGLLKVILALKNRQIPGTVNFTSANPHIDFVKGPFYVSSELQSWQSDSLRIAGISSFGVGGTNAHLIIQESLQQPSTPSIRKRHLIVQSGHTAKALQDSLTRLHLWAQHHPDASPAEVALTLQQGRRHQAHRHFIVTEEANTLAASLTNQGSALPPALENPHDETPVIFMFSGQGSQYPGMGRGLYESEPVFRDIIDQARAIFNQTTGKDLFEALYPSNIPSPENRLIDQTCYTQPALFAIEYGISQLLISMGILPSALIGHSIGEYSAAATSGVFSFEDGMRLVSRRGELMYSMVPGAMMVIPQTPAEITSLLLPDTVISLVNAPSSCVVSGPLPSIALLEKQYAEKGVKTRRVRTSHAFHSPMMNEAAEKLASELSKTRFAAPQIPYISNVSGTWITTGEATSITYWQNHLRNCVQFAPGLSAIRQERKNIFIEVGPGATLCSLLKMQQFPAKDIPSLSVMRSEQDEVHDQNFLLTGMGKAWTNGAVISWEALYKGESVRRIPLPSYPFQRQRCWVERGDAPLPAPSAEHNGKKSKQSNEIAKEETPVASLPTNRSTIQESLLLIWGRVLGVKDPTADQSFFDLGGHSLLAAQLFAEIEKTFGIPLPLSILYQKQTVAELAQVIGEKYKPQEWSPVVAIRKTGTNPPLFLIHGAEGNVLLFKSLTQHLGDEQPVYGIQAAGLDGRDDFDPTFEVVAAGYVKEIKRIQPTGPYLLGGYCLGGVIALEMAQQMKRTGDSVLFVGMIEIYNLRSVNWPFPIHIRIGNDLLNIYFHIMNTLLATSGGRIAFFSEKFRVQTRRVAASTSMLLTRLTKSLGMKGKTAYHHLNIAKIYEDALEQYPISSYDGHITLFNARNKFIGLTDSLNGFGAIASGGITVKTIPCYPRGTMIEPYVQQLAMEFREAIASALQKQS